MLFLTEFVQEQLTLTLGINMLLTVFCGIIQNKILLTFARTDKNLSWMFNKLLNIQYFLIIYSD